MVWERLGSASVGGTPPATSWKELGRQTLSSSGDVMTSGTITAKDNMMILYYGCLLYTSPSPRHVEESR